MAAAAAAPPQLLVIGLDGATYNVIDPLIQRGRLPHLARLMQQGARAVLRSTHPPYSAAAWTTFLTGLNPGHHGVYTFRQFDPELCASRPRGRFPDASRTLLGLLNRAGKRVACLGMPMTYPPFAINGVVVSGFDAPCRGAAAVHPPEAYAQFADLLDALTLHEGWHMDRGLEPALQEIARLTDLVVRVQTQAPCDIVMVVFPEADHVAHRAFKDFDPQDDQHPLTRTYVALDQAIGRLLAELAGDDTAVVVMSDHGTAPITTAIDMDALFRRLGLMGTREDGAAQGRGLLRGGLRALRTALRRVGLSRLVDLARGRAGLRAAVSRLNPAHPDNIDWRTVRAFAVSTDGFVRLNVAGRERGGIIPAEDLPAAQAEVMRLLREARDAAGRPLFSEVFAVAELYGEPLAYPETAPDLLVVPRPGAALIAGLDSDGAAGMLADDTVSRSEQIALPGGHDPDGILICRSQHTPRGVAVPPGDLQDMTPTLLYLAGAPVPDGLDGHVLTELFTADYVAAHPVRHGQSSGEPLDAERAAYTADEEEAVEARLRDLGYL